MLKTGGIIIQQERDPGIEVRRRFGREPGRERRDQISRTFAAPGIRRSFRDATPRLRRGLRALPG